jgi:capsular exopolysaccharide synthesis family protein
VRVDTPTGPTAADRDQDHVTRLKRAVAALRRSWYVLAALTLVGAALGWLSTPSAVDQLVERTQYHKAVHTLLADQVAPGETPRVNLSQAAYLVITGDIPQMVADDLGLEIDEVEGNIQGVARSDVSSIEIRAIGTDPDRVSQLADSAADALLDYLAVQAQEAFEQQRDDVVLELDRLDQELAELNARIAAGPPNLAQLEAQQRSLSNQYGLAYERFTQLADDQTTDGGLRSLGPAKAEAIDDDDYESIQDQISAGLPYDTPTATVPGQDAGAAEAATAGDGASSTTRAVAGALLGLLAGVGVILMLDRFDTRLRGRDDVESATDLPVVAEIPPLSRHQQHVLEVVARSQPRSRAAEAYRVVRGALLFQAGVEDPTQVRTDGEALTVLVTSANPEEGKTTTVANLAAVLAEGGLSVLVVNCDFRRPRVHKYLVASDTTEPATVTQLGPVVLADTHIPGVRLVTGLGETDHEANPLEVVALQRRIIAMARPMFDIILLDTAPFLTTNDASELLPETDHVIVVVRAGKTRRLAARRTAEVLERFEAPVLGVVLNDSDESTAAQYYYSYYLDGPSSPRRRSRGDESGDPGPAAASTPSRDNLTPLDRSRRAGA